MGYVYIVIAAVLWGLLGPVSKLAFAEGIAPLEVAFWRAALGGLCFAAHSVATGTRRRSGERIGLKDWRPVLLFGFVGVSLFYGAYQLSVDLGGATLASVLLYTAPVWVALASALLLEERLTARKLLALGLAVLGVTLVARGSGSAMQFSAAAIVWGLVAGLCYASYYPFSRYYFRRYAPANLYAWALPVGALGLLPVTGFAAKTPTAWAVLAVIGLASTYLAYLAYGRAMQHLEATRASIVATLEPVVAGAAAYGWWGERLGGSGYAGAALVLTGVLLVIAEPTRAASEAASA